MLRRCLVVTGSNRGLGLELVKRLANHSDPPELIFATCRDPDAASELHQIASVSGSRVVVKRLVVNQFDTFKRFVSDIKLEVESKGGVSCLINNAGISPKATRYNSVTPEQMGETFLTNATAPLLLSREMIPLLKIPAEGSLIVNMSSVLGSVELNQKNGLFGSPGGNYAYRASKTALNMITRSLAWDLEHLNINAVAIHPGWVKTEMGGPRAPLTVEKSIEAVVQRIMEFDPKLHNGQLVSFDGKSLPF